MQYNTSCVTGPDEVLESTPLIDRTRTRSADNLEERPLVAVMAKPWPHEVHEQLLAAMEVLIDIDLSFYADPRRLIVVRLRHTSALLVDEAAKHLCVSSQLDKLRERLLASLTDYRMSAGPFMWPLHDHETSSALLRKSIFEVGDLSPWTRGFIALRLYVPERGTPFLYSLCEHYGAGIAYVFAWSDFYVQKLWLLAVIALTAYFSSSSPAGSNDKYYMLSDMRAEDGIPRIKWEVFKLLVLAWGVAVFLGTRIQDRLLRVPDIAAERERVRNPNYRPLDSAEERWRRFKVVTGGLPLLLLLGTSVATILISAWQFNLWLAFDWGDCIHLGCRDAQEKHGFWGWLAEVCADVFLAIVFEGLLVLSKIFGEFMAHLHNYEWEDEYAYSALSYTIVLEAIGKALPYVVLAMVFVPRWEDPDLMNTEADCSDILAFRLIGPSAFACLARKIPLGRRRHIFKLLMKGPFVVAPFLSIVIKTIIPCIVRSLTWIAENNRRCCGCLTGVTRILGLIFSLDFDSVGSVRYVYSGEPFGHATLNQDKDATTMVQVDDVLEQAKRKPFEPLDELLELKLNLLFVMFFAPVMPIGVVPTLVARLLEGESDLAKLLLVRRRVFPEKAKVHHEIQKNFALACLCFAVVWSVILSLITYNDDLWKWRLVRQRKIM